jgi:predicted metalloendopeptidase
MIDQLTMGENIADMAGVLVALDAYYASLGGKPAPVLDGLTGDQRFFLAFGQVWRRKNREEAMRSQMASDPHTPEKFRCIGRSEHRRVVHDVQRDKRQVLPESRTSEQGSGRD